MWERLIHKDGKLIIARPHEATFKGKHNACKSKVLIVLYHRKYRLVDNTGLSLKELADASGVKYFYLETRLSKWVEWGYVIRKIKMGGNRPVYCYLIAKRGQQFVERRIPKNRLQDYIVEIQTFKASSPK
jgi:hypothetical protein